jgi:hypothetical protein
MAGEIGENGKIGGNASSGLAKHPSVMFQKGPFLYEGEHI